MPEANHLQGQDIQFGISAESLLTPLAMGRVDARNIGQGTPGAVLMARAAREVFRVIRGTWPRRPLRILCGPGNNGGDGWAVAALAQEAGWPVTVFSNWPAERLKGDARAAARKALGLGVTMAPLQAVLMPGEAPLIVDALFGAGLSKPISAEVAKVLRGIQENQWDVVAVDLPSGVDGKTGEVMGTACPAQLTVTFHRAKVGHLLGEGPALCGSVFVRDIGMIPLPEDACAVRNCPALWSAQLPYPPKAAHKYARGGVFVVGGPRHQTGAARLTAEAAARAGAGAVILGAAPSAIDIYAAHLTAIMVAKIQNEEDLRDLAQDKRVAAIAIGPGLSLGDQARAQVLTTCQVGKPMVIDADGLSLLTSSSSDLFLVLPEICVLTPHEGEFARIFPDLRGDALSRAQAAADRCGRTVLLKGATTVIASPGRLPILSTHATPYLATAGAGDVLTGIIVSLLAQGLPAHEAAAAGAYIHGDAGIRLGPGLTGDDLSKGLKPTLEMLSALS